MRSTGSEPTPEPLNDHRIYTFTSDGQHTPPGQYLVTIWPTGEAQMAWRPEPNTQIVWGPPLTGSQR